MSDVRPLREWLPGDSEGGPGDPEAVLDRFLDWLSARGLSPYDHQEEAFLELFAGRHVVLSTPTGSGKSLVALALHFKALWEGRRSFYTAPIKALVSEKFFALCDELGAESVGMLTGDASVNWAAPVICCTQEVLANMALRQGSACDAPYVVMDEFHYYADRDRGTAWQVPLLALPTTTFLLMSATLGNTDSIERALTLRTGRETAHVHSDERPVPLDYVYRDTPLLETVEECLAGGRAPVYIVHFTQREAAEQAQGLTSARVADREQRRAIAEAMGGFRFDTPYGRDVRRFLSHGVGLHHAGLLPKYRLLVEQLAQQGLLRVICGTDTLGVGVNIPIRTVLFSKLCKYDGEKMAILSVRDFKQIAGRAGRKGFDEQGSVVCQAPEHVVENKRLAARAAAGRAGGRKPAKKKPARDIVPWTEDTFRRLVERPPETLESRFRVSHGMLVSLLQREDAPRGGGYRLLVDLIALSHENERSKGRLRREAAGLLRSLRHAAIVDLQPDPGARGARVVVSEDLQRDFSLHHTLSLYLVDAVAVMDSDDPDYALDVLSVTEAILESPRAILERQRDRLKEALLARLKAEGVPYEDRIARLDEVEHPKPCADFIYSTFALFGEKHPWAGTESIRPKSIAREMLERYDDFADTVRRYGIQRSEGALLRYLSQVHNTLARNLPEAAKTEEVHDVIGYLRALLVRVDSSLVEEWESLVRPEQTAASEPGLPEPPTFDLARNPRAFRARVRAELHQLVRALAAARWDDAAAGVRQEPDDPWDAERFEAELAPFFEEHARIVFDPRARSAEHTLLKQTAPRRWDVWQTLVDDEGENLWSIEGEVDLSDPVAGPAHPGPLVRVRRIGT